MELPAHLEPTSAWREISAELRQMVGEPTYDIWLAPVQAKALDGTVLRLEAPPATRSWVAKRFGRILESCARAVLGSSITVSFTEDTGGRARGDALAAPAGASGTERFNPRYSFDQYIIGYGNRLAHAAALAVAEYPGQAYNPLFLHAAPGLGKTHLLHAIGNYVMAFGGGASVRYATVESFTNHFIAALGSRSLDVFKRAYRDADVLLIDDVQFLASKAKTEEEFFHTFNALYETGRQLVFTCDRLPGELVAVEERLRERFEAGLVANIQPPDFATRVAILRKRALLDGLDFGGDAVFELIAERVTDNVRALEGALIRIVAYHSLTDSRVDLELAKAVLDEMHPPTGPEGSEATIPAIQSAVASYYELTVGELLSAVRAPRIAWPRQVAIHLARQLTEASLNAIASEFGRSHATVVHACRRVEDSMRASDEVVAEVKAVAEAF
ncbi:MAG: chromosomal replication initiator protein DnaA, partial [Solirubrobacterales bacterium]|nr:chromosomal replication initiator protein DnaA [Solirubrobacterales bacterium]